MTPTVEAILGDLVRRVLEAARWLPSDRRIETDDIRELLGCVEKLTRVTTRLERLKTMPYGLYLATDWWKRISTERKMHDRYFCQKCGARESADESFNAHHLTYERRGNERIEDLVTLCPDCHSKTHGRSQLQEAMS